MARKSAAALKEVDKAIQEALDDFYLISDMKYEIAKSAYDAQDAETQGMIDKLVAVVTTHATGHITVDGNPVKIEPKYVEYNALYIVMDMLCALAMFDIRVGKYTFPAAYCAQCEAELILERKTRPKARQY